LTEEIKQIKENIKSVKKGTDEKINKATVIQSEIVDK